MTEFIKQNPDFLAITTIPTDEQIARDFAEGGARFDLVHGEYLATLSDSSHPLAGWTVAEDIALIRRAHQTAPAFNDLEERAFKILELKR